MSSRGVFSKSLSRPLHIMPPRSRANSSRLIESFVRTCTAISDLTCLTWTGLRKREDGRDEKILTVTNDESWSNRAKDTYQMLAGLEDEFGAAVRSNEWEPKVLEVMRGFNTGESWCLKFQGTSWGSDATIETRRLDQKEVDDLKKWHLKVAAYTPDRFLRIENPHYQ